MESHSCVLDLVVAYSSSRNVLPLQGGEMMGGSVEAVMLRRSCGYETSGSERETGVKSCAL